MQCAALHLALKITFVIGYFKQRNTFQIPAVIFLAILLKASLVSHPVHYPLHDPGGLLTRWLNGSFFSTLNPGFVNFISISFLLFTAFFADAITSIRRMFNRRHVLVSLSILLYTSLFPGINSLSAATLLLPLFVLLFKEITRLYTTNAIRTTIVNTGILAGTCYLLYHPFIFVLPACFIGLATMRTFRFSEWLLLLAGLITPAYFIMSYEYLTDQWQPGSHLPHWVWQQTSISLNWYWWMSAGAALAWVLAGFAGWQKQTSRMLIQGRKNWLVLIMLGLFCIPGIFIPGGNGNAMLTLMAFPAGSLMANAFAGDRKNLTHLVFFWVIILITGIASWGWKNGAM